MNALDAVSPELVLVSPQLGRPDAAAEGLAESILAGEALNESELARLLASQMGLPFVDLEHSSIDPYAAQLLSEDDARMYSALPIALVEGRALVAVARPTNEPAIRRVAEKLGRDVDLAVAGRADLLRAIGRANGHIVEPLAPAAEPPPATPEPEPLPAAPEPEPPPAAPEPQLLALPETAAAPAAVETRPVSARPRRRLRRRLVIAAAFVLAAPLTAFAGNLTAKLLDDGQRTVTPLPAPTTGFHPAGADEWAWPAGQPSGELPFSPAFRRRLETAAHKADVDPSLLRAAIRARRGGGSPNLRRIARRLRGNDPWMALLGLEGRTGYADRALALARYYSAAKSGLQPSVRLTPEARTQLESGLVDRRLVAVLGYLDEALGGVRVTSVARPRLDLSAALTTAHADGRAVAIDVDGQDENGTRLARAVRELLILPSELQPARIVSTLRVGRPAELHIAY